LANSTPDLAPWALGWVDAIGELYRLNAVRLRTALASSQRINAQAALEQAIQQMAQRRDSELAQGLPSVLILPVLKSMTVHWGGLTVFVAHPDVPMDNNVAERDMRTPVVGRKNFYGSGAQWSGELAATMYSVLQTLKLWGINARTWLSAYLQACADSGGKPPANINTFVPWQMDAKRLAHMRAPASTQEFDIQGINSS
jgi:transposase